MTRSANEVMALAAKAARGAGAPPAQAADFGRATVRHMHQGRDPSFLLRALDVLPDGPIMDFPIALLKIMERHQTKPHGQIDVTGWLPLAQSYVDALPCVSYINVCGETLDISTDLHTPASKSALGRITLPDAVFDRMNTLAMRILVPESDASRLAGAGAGLTDND